MGLSGEAVIAAYWQRIQDRDWDALARLLHPEVRVVWPSTGELFSGPDAVVDVNRLYPEGWSIQLLRLVTNKAVIVSEVQVPHVGQGLYRAASLWTVDRGLIISGVEYWVGVLHEEPPLWRNLRGVERLPLASFEAREY